MKMIIVLLTAAFLQVSAEGLSQTITFSGSKVPLEKVFAVVKQQTGYVFFYDGPLVRRARPVTIQANNIPLETFLNEVLKDQPLKYSIENNTIIISRRQLALLNEAEEIPPIDIRGRIVNGNGEPVRATIAVKGTSIATSTNDNGEFTLSNVEENATLVITGVSIETIEIKVNGRTDLGNISTVTKIAEEEVVVVGTSYTTTTKQKSTSSIVKIGAKEIERQPVTSLLMALQGRVPGLEVTPQAGGPASAPKIRIRGNNSLRVNGSFPLYIVDGIAIESTPVSSDNSIIHSNIDPLSTLSAENIESIEVLKDADATAIYGSRGANGVIVIRTKQSKNNQATNFNLNTYAGAGVLQHKMKLLDTKQYLRMRNEAFQNDNVVKDLNNAYDLLLWDTTRYTDWQEELLGGTANITDVQAVLSGGNQNTSFRFGTGYHKETLIFPGDFNYQRLTGSLGVSHLSTNKKLRVSINLNYGYEKNKLFTDLGILPAALALSPNAPALYDENGSLNWAPRPNGSSSFQNPLAALLKTDNSSTRNLVSNVLLSYIVVPGLAAKLQAGYTDLNFDEIDIVPIANFAPEFRNTTAQGRATFFNTKRSSWTLEPQLTYDIKAGEHSFSLLGGATFQRSNSDVKATYAEGYTSDALLGSLNGAGSYTTVQNLALYKYFSLFTRLQYDYNSRYLVSLSARRDGSSRFGPDKRFGYFYSIAPAWIFSNEQFTQGLSFLSFGKIRASYGITGNDQIGDYKYQNTFRFGTAYQGITSLVSSALFNPGFAWEVTKKLEIATELGFLENRISFEINWYRNISSNQLVEYQLPVITGFPSVFSNFDATIHNTGWEVLLNTVNTRGRKLKWNSSFNISFPKNKLAAFDGIENSPYNTTYKVGEPLSIQRLYTWIGIDPLTGRHRFADLNSNGIADDADKTFMNARDRKFYGGLLNSVEYKNIEISFLFQFAKQRANKFMLRMPGQFFNQPVSALSYWGKLLDISGNARLSQAFSALPNGSNPARDFSNAGLSSFNDADASFIRLKTLSLSYRFNPSFIKKAGMKDCRVFLQGQNLFTITGYENLDPETGSSLPPLRMITAGLNVQF